MQTFTLYDKNKNIVLCNLCLVLFINFFYNILNMECVSLSLQFNYQREQYASISGSVMEKLDVGSSISPHTSSQV